MTWLYQTFCEPWTHAYFVKGVLGGSIIAVACAVLGCYIILRKMAFIGDAMRHINIDLNHFFQGDIYGVSWADMWLSAAVASVVLATIIIFYRHFTIVSFDPTMAASIGLPTRGIHVVLTIMIALVCVAGISMVGVIMIVGLLITPAALAYFLTDRLPRMMVIAAVMGVLSVVAGLYFSEWVNASGGGSIMFMGFVLFVVGLVIAPRYGLLAGWLRRRRLVPESDVEDVLKAAYEGRTAVGELPLSADRVRRVTRRMVADGLLEAEASRDGRLALTAVGEREAAHVERAHQLWEGHLIESGMSPEEAHAAAEQLEHLHERRELDRFDNELGHPATDSHGLPVPGERFDLHDDVPLALSLLREGDAAKLVGCVGAWPEELSEGVVFTMGPRDLQSGGWEIRLQDGPTVHLAHDQADDLIVERVEE